MSDPDTPLDDEELLGLLSSALEGFEFDEADDPVPPGVDENSKWLHTFTQLDAELAELVSDSATSRPVGVRGSGGSRRITYAADDVEIEIEVAAIGQGNLAISGQVLPSMDGEVRIVVADASQTALIDEFGRFRFGQISAGLALVVIEGESHTIRIGPVPL